MTDEDCRILEFENQWWRHAGSKEAAIKAQFGMSPVRYYQVLTRLLDAPEALEFDPILVRRLRRIRSSRVASRRAIEGMS